MVDLCRGAGTACDGDVVVVLGLSLGRLSPLIAPFGEEGSSPLFVETDMIK